MTRLPVLVLTIGALAAFSCAANAAECVASDPASGACLMLDPSFPLDPADGDRRARHPERYEFPKGPLGGWLDVPKGYYVCALYDLKARRCLVRGNTEAAMESAVDLGAKLSYEMMDRRAAMLARIAGTTANQPPINAARYPQGSSRNQATPVHGLVNAETSASELISCLQQIHAETLTQTSCFDLEVALRRCSPE